MSIVSSASGDQKWARGVARAWSIGTDLASTPRPTYDFVGSASQYTLLFEITLFPLAGSTSSDLKIAAGAQHP